MTGQELKEWRRKKGLTQEELARRLGVIRLTVARWETGTRSIPSLLSLALVALEYQMKMEAMQKEVGHGDLS
ncbi:MAG: helix-turn-helix domain-containing protein [Desulfobaccales bacterium]